MPHVILWTLGVMFYFVGAHHAEHELRLAWDGYAYVEDPATGKVRRHSVDHPFSEFADMKYGFMWLSWLLSIPMWFRRIQKRGSL